MKDQFFRNAQTVQKLTRLQRAAIEHELRKLPDFQLYMVTANPHDRERMERLLEKLPAFRAWRRLSQRADGPTRDASASDQDHV